VQTIEQVDDETIKTKKLLPVVIVRNVAAGSQETPQ